MSVQINIANDFSDVPAGRHRQDGPYSGEGFRVSFLEPNLKRSYKVILHLDDTEGYGSSFLEEAFGGLVRENNFERKFLEENLVLISEDKILVEEIKSYLAEAFKVKKGE